MFVKVLLADQAVAAPGDSRIGRKHHDGVARVRRCSQGIEDAANLHVEVRDIAIVFRLHFSNLCRGARPGQELFVAHRHFPIIKRVLSHEVGGERNCARVVSNGKAVWNDMRVMRGVERDIAEERTILVPL